MFSHALHASFADASEQRATNRRVLRLEAWAATPAGESGIQIHNLSRTGMLVESSVGIPSGTAIEVEMPDGVRHRAEVIWNDADLFGCRFAKPLSQATLSAALLRAAPAAAPSANAAPVAENAALAKLRQHWAFEPDQLDDSRSELPLGTRLWAIIGLGLAAWAIPTALIAAALS